MSDIANAITEARSCIPFVEFARCEEWIQIDPMPSSWWPHYRYRRRHYRAHEWSQWQTCSYEQLIELEYSAVQSTVRLVSRDAADDWRARPGFACHSEVT